MAITKQALAGRIADYLHHRITRAQLVEPHRDRLGLRARYYS